MIIWLWMDIWGGLAIAPLRESMGKLSYEEEIDSFNESNNLLDKYK